MGALMVKWTSDGWDMATVISSRPEQMESTHYAHEGQSKINKTLLRFIIKWFN